MTGNNERQFRFGAIVHEDYQELAMLLPELEDRLNQNINLKDYTDRVERIYFAPILMPEGVNGVEEEKWFDKKNRAIFLKVRLPIQKLKNSIELNFLSFVGDYLSKNLAQLSGCPDKIIEFISRISKS